MAWADGVRAPRKGRLPWAPRMTAPDETALAADRIRWRVLGLERELGQVPRPTQRERVPAD